MITKFGGGGLLARFNYSVCVLVQDYITWYDWKEWLFQRVPKGFWQDHGNRMRYLAWLGQELGFKKPEDWYQVKYDHFNQFRGRGLLHAYNDSPFSIMTAHFPKIEWLEWQFSSVPRSFWRDHANCRRFMEHLGEKLAFKNQEDWYQLKSEMLEDNRGSPLLFKCGGVSGVLKDCFPEREWHEWKLPQVHSGFWDDQANVYRYLAWLAEKLGIEELDDWYRIQGNDFSRNHGQTLIANFGASVCFLMKHYFPDHDWYEWRFSSVEEGFWDHLDNVRRYVLWLGERLGFKTAEDWLSLRAKHITQNQGSGVLKRFQWSPITMLKACFPDGLPSEPRRDART